MWLTYIPWDVSLQSGAIYDCVWRRCLFKFKSQRNWQQNRNIQMNKQDTDSFNSYPISQLYGL